MNNNLFRGFWKNPKGKSKIFINSKEITGDFVEGNLFVDEKQIEHEILIGYTNYRISYPIIPSTAKRNTETLDCNNKIIFEGDIVHGDESVINQEFYGEIVYQDATFYVKSQNQGLWDINCARDEIGFYDDENNMHMPLHTFWQEQLEIVGNIFENPTMHNLTKISDLKNANDALGDTK